MILRTEKPPRRGNAADILDNPIVHEKSQRNINSNVDGSTWVGTLYDAWVAHFKSETHFEDATIASQELIAFV